VDDERVAELESVGALTEPVRRALYDFVAASPEPVGRDAAAAAIGVSRSLAAFHLDRLVETRLLAATYRRLSGRTGPGAGRPSKLYERAAGEHAVSLPPRRYDLAAELLAEAVETSASARAALTEAARRTGARIAAGGAATSAGTALAAAVDALRAHGFEPRAEAGRIVLANCPFHAIAVTHTELVCGANLALVEGVVSRIEDDSLHARLDPAPGRCCVVLEESKTCTS
jgi:predicted ArsR family transcriptional regulator